MFRTMAPLLLGAGFAQAALAQTAPVSALPPLTDDVRPSRASGVGLNVADVERSKEFYTKVLGFKVAARIPEQGPAQEYLLGMTGNRQTDTLVVLSPHAPGAGATGFGRVILVVPNARKLAERVGATGSAPTRYTDKIYMVKDPDGYMIELYQR